MTFGNKRKLKNKREAHIPSTIKPCSILPNESVTNEPRKNHEKVISVNSFNRQNTDLMKPIKKMSQNRNKTKDYIPYEKLQIQDRQFLMLPALASPFPIP